MPRLPRIAAALAAAALAAAALGDPAAGLAALAREYGLEIVAERPRFPVRTTHGLIEGQPASPEEVAAYAPTLQAEWRRYPPALVRRTRLRGIVLCRELSFAGQKRTAIPGFEDDTLYLDVTRGRHAPAYVRKVIHHEYFHLIDLRDDGELYRDEAWTRLNPPGFRYGSGGRNAQDDPTVSLPLETPGFLNRYAMTGVEEDKAELFAHLMVEPGVVARRARGDSVLRAKVRRLKALLAAFCPAVDRGFWKGREGLLEFHRRAAESAEAAGVGHRRTREITIRDTEANAKTPPGAAAAEPGCGLL